MRSETKTNRNLEARIFPRSVDFALFSLAMISKSFQFGFAFDNSV